MNRRLKNASTRLALLAVNVIAGSSIGAAPTTMPVRTLEDVESNYAAQLKASDLQHQKQQAAAQAERTKGLQRLLDKAMQNKDLDLAVSLRDKIKAGQPSTTPATQPTEPVDEVAAFKAKLTGTAWEWGSDETIWFQSGGKVGNTGWTADGLVTSWQAIDRRTVLLYIDRGRTNDRYAILCFDPAVDCYSVFGFGSAAFPLPQHGIKK